MERNEEEVYFGQVSWNTETTFYLRWFGSQFLHVQNLPSMSVVPCASFVSLKIACKKNIK